VFGWLPRGRVWWHLATPIRLLPKPLRENRSFDVARAGRAAEDAGCSAGSGCVFIQPFVFALSAIVLAGIPYRRDNKRVL
jgi:hypothetical protein